MSDVSAGSAIAESRAILEAGDGAQMDRTLRCSNARRLWSSAAGKACRERGHDCQIS